MKNDISLSSRLASCLYKLVFIKRLHMNEIRFRHDRALQGMLLFNQADGSITIDGRAYPLQQHSIFLLPSEAAVKLSGDTADYYYIGFHVLHLDETGQYIPAPLSCQENLTCSHYSLLLDKLQELERMQDSEDEWDALRMNILFQELLLAVFKSAAEEPKSDLKQAIQYTLEYMDQNYSSRITREKLAELAGFNADYYSRTFKQEFEVSPMEYLTGIRINQAKQLLIQTSESVGTIARSIGFSDEFYFSRKFKARTGSSPMAYIKKMKRSSKIASLNHLSTGHLLALDIEPYAAVINNAYPVTDRLRNTIAIGQSMPDLEKLVTAKPDLIVMRGTRDEMKSSKEKIYSQIAPTITLQFSEEWRVHFQQIAKIVGREKEADLWLERYETKAEGLRKQLKARMGEERVLVLAVGERGLYVYGRRNMGSVLFGDLKLGIPEGIRTIEHYKEVELKDVSQYDADRILLTSHQHDGSMRMDKAISKRLQELFESKHWLELKAVRNNYVYRMYDSRHLYTSYNALSQSLLLDKVQQLLMPDYSE